MTIKEIKERDSLLIRQLLDIWEKSVRATHNFLSDAEILQIKKYVPEALSNVCHLLIAEKESGQTVGFLGAGFQKIEMLFLLPEECGKGFGKMLVQDAIEKFSVREVTVNEQNPSAKGFYEHLGFKPYKRSEIDEQGNPYPILHLKKV